MAAEGRAPGREIAGGAATLLSPPDGGRTSAYLDAEIARFFLEQDEDDAAVLLLAIAATIH